MTTEATLADASGGTHDERITELEDELAAARRTIDVLIERLERSGSATPTQTELFDAAVRLGNVLEERTREVEDARAEFRALRANLDQIVRQRTRALAESEAQLRVKNTELVRQSKIKAEFISIAAHELRTPLTSIVGYLDLFSEGRFGELPPLLDRPMSSVRRNAHRLKRLVDDMLSVSRIEGGQMTLRREPVNLGEVVSDVVTELLPLVRTVSVGHSGQETRMVCARRKRWIGLVLGVLAIAGVVVVQPLAPSAGAVPPTTVTCTSGMWQATLDQFAAVSLFQNAGAHHVRLLRTRV